MVHTHRKSGDLLTGAECLLATLFVATCVVRWTTLMDIARASDDE
jgi:hypothetical protein